MGVIRDVTREVGPVAGLLVGTLLVELPSAIALIALLVLVAGGGHRRGREPALRVAMWSTAAFVAIVGPRAPERDGVLAAVELGAMALLVGTALVTSRAPRQAARRGDREAGEPPPATPLAVDSSDEPAALAR